MHILRKRVRIDIEIASVRFVNRPYDDAVKHKNTAPEVSPGRFAVS